MRELLRYRALVRNLVLKDLKLKYRDSLLGFLWSLMNPLLMLSVYTLAFEYVLRVQMEDYPYFLLVALLPWQFFASSAQAATLSISGNAPLIQKVSFPREVLPISTVLFGLAQLLLALGVLLPAALLAFDRPLPWTAALLPLLLLLHLAFTLGAAFLLSTLATFFRDVVHLTEVALVLLFWLTPILYPISMAPPWLRLALEASPLAAFALAYQDLLFWGRLPEPAVLAMLAAAPPAIFVAGLAVFRRFSGSFPEAI
jgi:ABC-type polysaccharide/polyol phosphate export permease